MPVWGPAPAPVPHTSPQRVLLGIDKGRRAADMSLKRAPAAGHRMTPSAPDAGGDYLRRSTALSSSLGLGGGAAEGGDEAAATEPAEVLPKTLLTLAVSQREAERVMYATQNGTLALGLLDDESEVAPSQGVVLDNLFR